MSKILLAAIAKDEACYLPEWIYHHANIGFDNILIFVNNTSDNTISMLDKISEHYPVEYKVVDGIEKNNDSRWQKYLTKDFMERNPLQASSYGRIIADYKHSYSHIAFLDIDEFLYCKNEKSIDGLRKISGVTYFRWMNLAGDKINFSLLSNAEKGEYSHYTKYLINTNLPNVRLESTHSVTGLTAIPPVSEDYFILHRNLRGKLEYISLLGRKDTFNNTINGFKSNRKGWSTSAKLRVPVSDQWRERHQQGYEQFITQCGLKGELNDAQNFVKNRANDVIKQIVDIKKLNYQLDDILYGTDLQHHPFSITFSFKKFIRSVLKPKNVNQHD